jgi:anti-sigma factor RsiW
METPELTKEQRAAVERFITAGAREHERARRVEKARKDGFENGLRCGLGMVADVLKKKRIDAAAISRITEMPVDLTTSGVDMRLVNY